MKTTDPSIKQFARVAFPEYKGRKFALIVTDKPQHFQLYCDGGTWDTLKAVELATGRIEGTIPAASNPYRADAHGAAVPVPGWALVCHAHFCGQDCGLTVYVHPSNVASLQTTAGKVLAA